MIVNGRACSHRNIVRSLQALGTWSGAPADFAVAAATDPALRSAILAQEGKGGAIIAAHGL